MWTIIEKEFLENLLNLRFLIGTLVAVLLTIGCIMLQASDYAKRVEDYRFTVASQEEYNAGFETRQSFMVNQTDEPLIPPETLSPLANGLQTGAKELFDENFLTQIYPVLDLVFIVSVIMSLMAVLFSHDSICGERERGTLRLIQSNPVPRTKLILAKWLGGSSSILLPLVVSCLAGMIYISLSPRMQLGAVDWFEVLLILLASMAFISVFYLLGLMLSALSRIASTAALTAVLVWAVLVFIVPSLGPYLATRIEPVASINERIQRTSAGAWKKFWEDMDRQMEAIRNRYALEYGQMYHDYRSWSDEERSARTGEQAPESPVRNMGLKYRKEMRDTRQALMNARYEEIDRLDERVKQEWERQTRLSRNISAVSPFADYVFLATDLAGTGVESRKYDSRQADAFVSILKDYTLKWVRKVTSTNSEDFDKLGFDPNAWPRFEYKRQPLAERLKAVLPFWTVLLFFNILFFTGAYVAFLRYNVR